jgi:hypothetical protein
VPVMRSAPFALLSSVIRTPVFGRAYSGTPTLFHAGLYEILRKLEGEGPKYFARRGISNSHLLHLGAATARVFSQVQALNF